MAAEIERKGLCLLVKLFFIFVAVANEVKKAEVQ